MAFWVSDVCRSSLVAPSAIGEAQRLAANIELQIRRTIHLCQQTFAYQTLSIRSVFQIKAIACMLSLCAHFGSSASAC